jgi:hypothetical protein
MLDDCSLSDDFHLKYAIQAFQDWKIWVTMLITIGSFTRLYSISLSLCKANPSPRLIKGHAILIGLISMSFILTTFMTYYYRRENHRRDALMRNKNMTIGDYSSDMKWEERERGDDASFFRYTV